MTLVAVPTCHSSIACHWSTARSSVTLYKRTCFYIFTLFCSSKFLTTKQHTPFFHNKRKKLKPWHQQISARPKLPMLSSELHCTSTFQNLLWQNHFSPLAPHICGPRLNSTICLKDPKTVSNKGSPQIRVASSDCLLVNLK